jgi:hypothetical protein
MGYIPAMFSKDSVTFYIDGQPYSSDASHAGYPALLDELKSANPDVNRLVALTRPIEAIRVAVEDAIEDVESADYLPKGVVSVTRNAVLYNGEPLEGVLVERILGLLAEGFNIMPMVRFLENLFQNPADFARDELYLWLEGSNLPITEDGHFLAYKRVLADYTSIHDRRTDNSPGTVVQMPRQEVDPVRDRTCSRGLHFCSKDYLPHFGSDGNGHKTVLLKINPADVVSIPSDYSNTKGRAWKYEVLHDVADDPQTKVWKAVTAADGTETLAPAPRINPSDRALTFPSDLSKALFAALGDIGVTDRDDRLDWGTDVLDELFFAIDNGEEDEDERLGDWNGFDDVLGSFTDLTVGQASILLEAAREIKAKSDQAEKAKSDEAGAQARQAEAKALEAKRAARDAEYARIDNAGIVTLRGEAASKGYAKATGRSPWTGVSVQELRTWLKGNVRWT